MIEEQKAELGNKEEEEEEEGEETKEDKTEGFSRTKETGGNGVVNQKKNWRSIETFRLHKTHCRQQQGGDGKREAAIVCGDCSAEFTTRLEYRDHIRHG